VRSGGTVVYNGGTLQNLTVLKGGREVVSGGTLTLSSGQTVRGLVVGQYGEVNISSGAVATYLLDSGGSLYIYGKTVGAKVANGGYVYLYGHATNTVLKGAPGYPYGTFGTTMVIAANGLATATSTTVGSGSILEVDASGRANGVTVQSGGRIAWSEGARISNLRIESGGSEAVYGNGVISGATIGKGVTLLVSSAGTATDIHVTGGGQIIFGGGVVNGLKIAAGGQEAVASYVTVSGLTVDKGVRLVVSSGGTAADTTLNGGTEAVMSGGTINGAVTFGTGGKLVIAGPPPSSLTLSGFKAGDTLDLVGLNFGAGEKLSFVENKAKTQGTLTITDRALKTSVTLFGNYVAAGFHRAADAYGGTTITYGHSSAGGHADIAPGHG